jgi:putative methionine-R-sulfoxide reductase with GAF domain
MGWVNLREVNFLSLQTAVFCIECELISQNTSSGCLACGSQALLSLSRVLGGSLRNQQTAHLIVDSELDRLVRELIHTVPQSQLPTSEPPRPTRSRSSRIAERHHVRIGSFENSGGESLYDANIAQVGMDFEPAFHVIAERAQTLTRASGAAIALRKGSEIVCRARTGRTAPDLGVRLQSDSGISAECVRTGEVVMCHDARHNPQVDLASCNRLGVRSILAAPLRHFRQTLGIFEVLSPVPYAFNQTDVATMQMLASMIVAAIARVSDVPPDSRQDSVSALPS